MPEEYDPFTAFYNKLWQVLEAHEGLSALVRSGNRIKFVKDAGDHDPRKSGVDAGTTPELMIIPDYFTGTLQLNNSQALLDRRWSLVIKTSFRMLNRGLFPIEYELFKALQSGKKELQDFKYNGQNLILHVQLERGSSKIPDVDKENYNPYNISWFSMWSVVTRMNMCLEQSE